MADASREMAIQDDRIAALCRGGEVDENVIDHPGACGLIERLRARIRSSDPTLPTKLLEFFIATTSLALRHKRLRALAAVVVAPCNLPNIASSLALAPVDAHRPLLPARTTRPSAWWRR